MRVVAPYKYPGRGLAEACFLPLSISTRIHTGNACCRELYTAHVWYVQCSERTVGLFYILTLILTYITQIDPVLTRGGTTTSGVVSDPVSTVTSTVRDVSGGKREASCALLALFSGRPIG